MLELKSGKTRISAPAYPSATGGRVSCLVIFFLSQSFFFLFTCVHVYNEKIRKFYRAANGIFRIEGRCNDLLTLRLIESHCIPILSYGIEVIHVADQDTRRQLRVAYNSVFRRIFSYRPWQSVRELQSFLSRPT